MRKISRDKYTKNIVQSKLFMIEKIQNIMCACKQKSSNRQVTSVKQVVKKAPNSENNTKPERTITKPRVNVFKRPL